jgi:hemerythrin-like domain-containing protein
MPTELLKRQHDSATLMMLEIQALSDRYRGPQDAHELALRLGKFAALLRTHFALEDRTVYEALLHCGECEVERVASDFFADVGGLAEKLEDFGFRWSTDTIAASFGQFRAQLTHLCEALSRRIALENAYLYPLVENRGLSRAA